MADLKNKEVQAHVIAWNKHLHIFKVRCGLKKSQLKQSTNFFKLVVSLSWR